jgi:import inner membrane translocase subunit TIM13
MEKYMAAWNQVNTTYIQRIQQELGNQTMSNE